MKSSRKFLAAFFAACFFAVAAFATDATPAGTWKWTSPGRGGNPGAERTLVLDYKDGKLIGTLKGVSMGQFEIPDLPVTDGTFKDGEITFNVTADFNGNKFTSKYSGKLEGDSIKGSIERPGRDGGTQKSEWNPKREPAK